MMGDSTTTDARCDDGTDDVRIGDTLIEDTFAEAFGMRYVRLLITAVDDYWLEAAVQELTGYSASVISCDAECGLDRRWEAEETPDGRPGASVLIFGFSDSALAKAAPNRVGQCVMTCPTTAVFDAADPSERSIPLGKNLRFFGDGFQKSKRIDSTRYWRVPVMDGEFLIQDVARTSAGVAGGNLILQAIDPRRALSAARRAAESVAATEGVMAPFPGGVVRSGSKVGSRYKALRASTSDSYCPTLRGRVESRLHPDANCAYEIVIDGIDESAVGGAMAAAIRAAAGEGVVQIGAGNYGGKLGKHHFHLRQLLGD